MPPDGGSPDLRERVQRSRRTITARVAELLRWGIDGAAGARDGLDVDLLARLVVAIGEDGARLVVAHPRRYSPDRLAGLVEQLVALVPRAGSIPAPRSFAPAAAARTPAADPGRRRPGPARRAARAAARPRARADRRGRLRRAQRRGAGPPRGRQPRRRLPRLRRPARAAARADAARAGAGARRSSTRSCRRTRRPHAAGAARPDRSRTSSTLVTGDVLTWRVALLRPESAPAIAQKVVARQRNDLAAPAAPARAVGPRAGCRSTIEEADADLLARLLLTVAEELGRIALEEPTFPRARLADSTRRFLSLLPWE